MKKLISILALVMGASSLLAADAANDILLNQRNGTNDDNVQRNVTATANSLFAFDGSLIPTATAAPILASVQANASGGLLLKNFSGTTVMNVGPGSGTGVAFNASGLTSVNSVTAADSTALTLAGGSSGASLVLGQGATAGNATITPTGTGVVAIAGTGSKLTIAGTTASTSTTSGALQVAGGVGVADKVWVGGAYTSTLSAGINVTGVNIPAITLQSAHASGRNYFIGSNYSANGILSIAGSTTAGGAATNIIANIDSTAGTVSFQQTTASTNTTSGALIVSGGVGVSGAVNVGGNITTSYSGSPALAAISTATPAATSTLYLGNTAGTAQAWTFGMGGSSAGTIGGVDVSRKFFIYDNTSGNTRFSIDTTGAATFAGAVTIAGTVIHTLSATPASASAAGTVGTMSWDANYIYICTAANTWKRVAIATW